MISGDRLVGEGRLVENLDPEPVGIEDPLDWYAYRLLERGSATSSQLQRIHDDVCAEVDAALGKARAAPDAGAEQLGLDDVFA